MNIGYVFLVVMVGMAYFVSGVPTPEEMIAEFQAAQKFYTSKAYDQALEKYEHVARMKSRFLDEEKVVVTIGTMRSPVKDLCLYQSGNAYYQLARDEKDRAAQEKDAEKKQEDLKKGEEYVQKAAENFDATQQQTKNRELQAQAQNRIVEAWFLINSYDRVISEGGELIKKYPASPYVQDALYNIGWAYYYKKEYDESIKTLNTLVSKYSSGNMVDMSLFQIGEAYFDQGRYGEAAPYYQRLVEKMRINEMTDQEIQKMQRQKLSGLVDQTSLDLAAKAQLKVGACYAKEKRYAEAEVAYKRIATMFRFDKALISKAYQDLADMYLSTGNFERSIKAYRDAIDEVPDKVFSAKMQALIAQRYFENNYFDKAIAEFDNYIAGYSDVAIRAGFEVDKALYYLGRSYYEYAMTLRDKKQTALEKENLSQAFSTLENLLKQFPDTDLRQHVYYYIGLAYQEYATPEYLQKAIDQFNKLVAEFPDSPNRKYCYFQIAAAFHDLKKYDDAVTYYNKIITEYPDDSVDLAWFKIAQTYRDAGRNTETVEPYKKVSRANPRMFTMARLLAAQTLMDEQKYKDAFDVLSYAVEDTSAIDGPLNLSRIYLRMGGAQKSIADANNNDTETLNQAIHYYTLAADMNIPETVEQAKVFRAGALISMNQFERAEADLKQLVKSDDPKIKRDAQMRLAVISAKQNKSEQAIETYYVLYQSAEDPDEKIDFLRNIIQISAAANETQSLVKYCNMMINSDLADGKKPQNSQAYYKEEAFYYLANAFEKQGEYHRAVDSYLEGFRRFPDSYFSSDMLLKVGFLYITRLVQEPGALDNAAEYFDKYVKVFPNTSSAEMAYYYLGFCYANGKRFTEAKRTFMGFAERYPNSEFTPEAYFYYADACYNLGDFEEAVRGFNTVISKYPTHEKAEEALFTKAWALLEMKRDEEAINALKSVAERYPRGKFAASALFSVADYYYNQQKYEDALALYKNVLAKYPDSDVAVKIPDTVKELSETIAYTEYEKAFTIFSQAKEKSDLNLYRQSVAGFRKIVDNYPGTESETGAYANMGFAYEELGEYQKAVDAYNFVMKKLEQGGAVSQEAFTFARMHRDYIVANKL